MCGVCIDFGSTLEIFGVSVCMVIVSRPMCVCVCVCMSVVCVHVCACVCMNGVCV